MTSRKSIIIAGASSGIGAALSRALSEDGHDLYICARRLDRLARVAEGGARAFYAACDVAHETDVMSFAAQVRERAAAIDVLIYAAGVLGPIGLAPELDGEEWFDTLRTNLFGAFLVAKHVAPMMLPDRRPRILVIAGGGAFDPMPNVSAYGVSKAGLIRLVETLAVELAPRNIAVNAIAPGFVATDIHRATFAAGPKLAGAHYEKTMQLYSSWNERLDIPIDCVRYMISDASRKLTGKTISARYDPWGEPEFDECIDAIMASPLYSTQRTTVAHIDDALLVERLSRAAERKRRRYAAEAAGSRARASSDS